MVLAEVNYLAVLVAATANLILGAIWYGPLFGKRSLLGMGAILGSWM